MLSSLSVSTSSSTLPVEGCRSPTLGGKQTGSSAVDQPSWAADAVLPRLATLLDAAEYSSADKAWNMALTDLSLVQPGYLGPPRKAGQDVWPSYLTDDHTPIEYSIDISPGKVKVRYAFEALSSESGRSDPLNVQAPRAWQAQARSCFPSLHFDWFDRLVSLLVIDNSPGKMGCKAACGLTQILYAIDLEGRNPILKTYVLLDATRRALGEAETMKRVQQAASDFGLSQQWDVLTQYLSSEKARGTDNGAKLEFISVDCLDPQQARFKPYVRFSHLTKADFLRHLRLNRSNSAPRQQYERLCSDLWDVFCDDDIVQVDSGAGKDGQGDAIQQRTHGAIFYYEMRANSAQEIQPKAYLPVRHMLKDDALIAQRIDGFLAARQLRPQGWYLDLVRRFASHRHLADKAGVQTMIGVALKNGKPSVSIYLNPESHSI